jgi:hypothetical protein
MFMVTQPQEGQGFHSGYTGALALGAVLWLILLLTGCSSARKEYVVDFTRGNDVTAEGSRERPCQTEVYCRTLAERDGVRSYWMVYQ